LLGAVIATVAAYKLVARTRTGRFVIDRFKLRVPLFGNLNRKTRQSPAFRVPSGRLSRVVFRFCRH